MASILGLQFLLVSCWFFVCLCFLLLFLLSFFFFFLGGGGYIKISICIFQDSEKMTKFHFS